MATRIRLGSMLAADVEMTCFDGPPPPGETPEIIQIGIREFDPHAGTLLRQGMWYVRNEYSSVSKKCTELTGITQKTLDKQGRPYREVGSSIAKLFGRSKGWIAWGSDDEAFLGDCGRKGVEPFMSPMFFNVGFLHSASAGLGRAVGLDEAAAAYGIVRQGQAHDALGDAELLAEVWIAMSRGLVPPPPSESSDPPAALVFTTR